MSKIQLSKNFIRNTCKLALAEDLYPEGDITSGLLDNNINKKVKLITKGKILTTDIKKMEKLDKVTLMMGDMNDKEFSEKIYKYFNEKVDVVISDMAPNTTGNKNLDAYRTGELCINAMDLSKKILSNDKYIKVLGNGEQRKPYSSANEIIHCIMYITKKKHFNLVNFYNIGANDKGVKVKDIVKLLIKKFD